VKSRALVNRYAFPSSAIAGMLSVWSDLVDWITGICGGVYENLVSCHSSLFSFFLSYKNIRLPIPHQDANFIFPV
jgi:hypothetical protein